MQKSAFKCHMFSHKKRRFFLQLISISINVPAGSSSVWLGFLGILM